MVRRFGQFIKKTYVFSNPLSSKIGIWLTDRFKTIDKFLLRKSGKPSALTWLSRKCVEHLVSETYASCAELLEPIFHLPLGTKTIRLLPPTADRRAGNHGEGMRFEKVTLSVMYTEESHSLVWVILEQGN